MPRKPAQLVGGLGLRQALWNRIRRLASASAMRPAGDFSLDEIVYGAEVLETARDYILGLERAGYLAVIQEAKQIGNGWRTKKRWKLIHDVGLDAPRVRRDGTPVTMGLAQEQMWRTLRMLAGDTNARELAAHASTPEIPVAESAAGDYLRNLHHADYLICTQPARTTMKNGGKSPARYRLKPAVEGKGNTGPRAPMVCRTQVLYDPNTDTSTPIERVTEELFIYGK